MKDLELLRRLSNYLCRQAHKGKENVNFLALEALCASFFISIHQYCGLFNI